MVTTPLLFLAALGGPQTGPQGPLAKPISIDLPAEPVPKLIADLSKASGIPMEAAMTMRGDVVILHAHNLSMSEIQKKLATTLDATWRLDKGTYRLTRTDGQATNQENRERKHRVEQIEEELAKSKANRESKMTPDSAKKLVNQFVQMRNKNPMYAFQPYLDLSSPFAATPSQKLLLRLVNRLDPAELAMLQPGDRIVYSDHPTKMQRKLPFDTGEFLSDFSNEQSIWNDAVAAAPPPAQTNMRSASDPLGAPNIVSGTADRVVLMAARTNSMSSVQFQLYITAGEKVAGFADFWLASDFIRDISKNFLKEPATVGVKIPLSPKSLMFLDMTKGFAVRNGAPTPDPTPEQIALITHPEDTDPLALCSTDAFAAMADAKHLNLIASIPDELVGLNFLPTMKSQTLDGFASIALGVADLSMEEKNGWLTVTPNRPFSARFDRMDRSALGKYLRSIVTNGRATLDAQGEYALNSPATDYDELGMPMGSMIDLNSTQNVDKDWDSLKLWGSLSRDQRDALLSGKQIAFRDLTPLQISLVEREAYHHPSLNFVKGSRWEGGGMRLSLEPTEILPDGIRPDGMLSIASKSSVAVLASSTIINVRLSYARLFSPMQLGSMLTAQDDPNNDWKPMFNRFQLVNRVEYTITYQFTPMASNGATLHDVVVPAASKPVALSDLPSDIQKDIAIGKENGASNGVATSVKRVPPP